MESFIQAYSDKGYNEPTILYLREIYDQIEVNQVFGSAYIMKTLECSERTARNLLTKLKDMEVIEGVTGKGMYRIINIEEV